MTHDEMIAVIQAHKEGKTIEYYSTNEGKWCIKSGHKFNFASFEYRVEPQVLWINKNAIGEYYVYDNKVRAEKMASVFGSKTYKFVEEL